MNADSAFIIGKSHAVCQDYAVAGSLRGADGDEMSYGIVSDGCSSSPDTDIGARLLTKAAERLIRDCGDADDLTREQFFEQAAQAALEHARLAGIEPAAVDATLVAICAQNGRLVAACYGDGAIALKSRAGYIDVYSIAFAGNCPRYPSLALQPARLKAFEALDANTKEVSHARLTTLGNLLFVENHTVSSAIEVISRPTSELEYAAVMSDGVGSLVQVTAEETGQRVEPVDLNIVVRDLVAFKTPAGAFVQRRLQRFAGQCQKQHRRNADDIAVAAIYLGG